MKFTDKELNAIKWAYDALYSEYIVVKKSRTKYKTWKPEALLLYTTILLTLQKIMNEKLNMDCIFNDF